MFGLRTTRRCWTDDLGQHLDDANRPRPSLHDLEGSSDVVRAFLRERAQVPSGTEGHVVALGRRFSKLKTGRWRAVTIFEEAPLGQVTVEDPDLSFAGVVWLGAVGFRKDGDADDAYEVFAKLGANAIEPTPVDYTDLLADIHAEAFKVGASEFSLSLRYKIA